MVHGIRGTPWHRRRLPLQDTVPSRTGTVPPTWGSSRNSGWRPTNSGAITLEQAEPSDILRWREESDALLSLQKSEKEMSDATERIWTKGYVRAFLSHKAECKLDASALKTSLMNIGVSAFVAHEDIEPTKKWLDEIELALSTQDVCVTLLTERFRDSKWTDQEIGIAIGRGVPVVAMNPPINSTAPTRPVRKARSCLRQNCSGWCMRWSTWLRSMRLLQSPRSNHNVRTRPVFVATTGRVRTLSIWS